MNSHTHIVEAEHVSYCTQARHVGSLISSCDLPQLSRHYSEVPLIQGEHFCLFLRFLQYKVTD
jgi:hypothetical protein